MKIKLHRGDFGWWFGISTNFQREMMLGRFSMVYDGCRMHALWILGIGFQLWEAGKGGEV